MNKYILLSLIIKNFKKYDELFAHLEKLDTNQIPEKSRGTFIKYIILVFNFRETTENVIQI